MILDWEAQDNAAFLSIQAQDFIEDTLPWMWHVTVSPFLSIQAQDFIEERNCAVTAGHNGAIPEHSSSGLH